MTYSHFLASLFEDGRLRVVEYAPLDSGQLQDGDKVLAHYEELLRPELPGEPPEFRPDVAQWAGVRLFRACQLIVFRDLGSGIVDEALGDWGRSPDDPAVHYSVDLTFRYLPDVMKFGRAAAPQDPLIQRILALARAWPLSSVGIADVGGVSSVGFAAAPTLLRLYADRIIARDDRSRLSDAAARDAVREALGAHAELAPGMDQHLRESS